ncbi:MAG: hypothetical protein PHE89_05170 [Alphaproteobacteria bacterium]|nr:hypothetical protein [Alphaproteobacteria bacterium]
MIFAEEVLDGFPVLYSSELDDFSLLPEYGEVVELEPFNGLRIISKEQKKEGAIDRLEKYKSFRLNQKISLRYRDLPLKIKLKPSEFVLLGVKKKLKEFNQRFFSYGKNFADEILSLKVIFIMKDNGKTKVYFQVE